MERNGLEESLSQSVAASVEAGPRSVKQTPHYRFLRSFYLFIFYSHLFYVTSSNIYGKLLKGHYSYDEQFLFEHNLIFFIFYLSFLIRENFHL